MARILAEILVRDKFVNQQVSVTNRTGGADTVAYNHIKSRKDDPHVILTGVSNTLLSASLRPEFNVSLDQFHLLAMFARGFAMGAGVPKEAAVHMEAVLEKVYHGVAWKAHTQANHYENIWMGSAKFTKYFNERQAWVRKSLNSIGAVKS